jgi:hypothetical protein
MKIVSFIEAGQGEVIRKILDHCGLWQDPPPRAPPHPARSSQPDARSDASRAGVTYEVDPDFLEHTRREQFVQPELPW